MLWRALTHFDKKNSYVVELINKYEINRGRIVLWSLVRV